MPGTGISSIAIFNAFEDKAENELEKRILIALERLGIRADVARDSGQLLELAPDLVLALSFDVGKLTGIPTFAPLWGTLRHLLSHPDIVKSALSFDAYLAPTERSALMMADLCRSVGKPFFSSPFAPSCHRTEFVAPAPSTWALAYAGTDWERKGKDVPRHAALFDILDKKPYLRLYGPSERWTERYSHAGAIPFDGVSVLEAYRTCGAVLCLHADAHLVEALPTMRVFEAAAAGAVAICDLHDFVIERFGDSVLYVDTAQAPEQVAEQIDRHMEWIDANPDAARELARGAHAVFAKDFALEDMIERALALVEPARRAAGYVRPEGDTPQVQVVVRSGLRQSRFLRRTLASLAKQSYPNVGIILALQSANPRLKEVVEEFRPSFASLKILEGLAVTPRSRSLWAGLKAVDAPLFAVLDEGDALMPHHLSHLVAFLQANPDASLAYSGAVRAFEGADPQQAGRWKEANWPRGSRAPEETRHVFGLEPYDSGRLLGENYIPLGSWVCRSPALAGDMLDDPGMDAAEDYYLTMRLARGRELALSPQVSAEVYWEKDLGRNAPNARRGRRGFDMTRARVVADPAPLLSPAHPFTPGKDALEPPNARPIHLVDGAEPTEGEGGEILQYAAAGNRLIVRGWTPFLGYSPAQHLEVVCPEAADLGFAFADTFPELTGANDPGAPGRCGVFVELLLPEGAEAKLDQVRLVAHDRGGKRRELGRAAARPALFPILLVGSSGFGRLDVSSGSPCAAVGAEAQFDLPTSWRDVPALIVRGRHRPGRKLEGLSVWLGAKEEQAIVRDEPGSAGGWEALVPLSMLAPGAGRADTPLRVVLRPTVSAFDDEGEAPATGTFIAFLEALTSAELADYLALLPPGLAGAARTKNKHSIGPIEFGRAQIVSADAKPGYQNVVVRLDDLSVGDRRWLRMQFTCDRLRDRVRLRFRRGSSYPEFPAEWPAPNGGAADKQTLEVAWGETPAFTDREEEREMIAILQQNAAAIIRAAQPGGAQKRAVAHSFADELELEANAPASE